MKYIALLLLLPFLSLAQQKVPSTTIIHVKDGVTNQLNFIIESNAAQVTALQSYTSQVVNGLSSNYWASADSTTNYASRVEFVTFTGNISNRSQNAANLTNLLAIAGSGLSVQGGQLVVTNVGGGGGPGVEYDPIFTNWLTTNTYVKTEALFTNWLATNGYVKIELDSIFTNWLDTNTYVKVEQDSAFTNWLSTNTYVKAEQDLIFTNWLNTNTYVKTESDPVWTVDSTGYLTKVSAASLYATGTPLYSYLETDPVFTNWLSTNTTLTAEFDPVFTNWLTTNSYVKTEIDPIFTNWLATNIIVTTEFDPVFTNWLNTNSYVQIESDPVFTNWLGTNSYLQAETDPVFTNWLTTNTYVQSTVFTQGLYLKYTGTVANSPGFSMLWLSSTNNGESDPNPVLSIINSDGAGSEYGSAFIDFGIGVSGYVPANGDVLVYRSSNKTWRAEAPTGGSETDPVFTNWLSTNLYIQVETDPVFTNWLATNLLPTVETDPVFTNWLTTNAYIQVETDPVFTNWVHTNTYVKAEPARKIDWGYRFEGSVNGGWTRTFGVGLDDISSDNTTNIDSYAVFLYTVSTAPVTNTIYGEFNIPSTEASFPLKVRANQASGTVIFTATDGSNVPAVSTQVIAAANTTYVTNVLLTGSTVTNVKVQVIMSTTNINTMYRIGIGR